ncbi:MAG TPA: biosynthetic peptidoglycan transglycosylase [Gemmatimonadales bacterium]|nr:biosynthetic peptidoglycan transglycosylase [Gemmatimonadales bacterium]
MKTVLKALAVAAAGFLFWLLAIWPPPLWYRTHWPAETAFMWMRRGERGGNADSLRQYRPVPLDSIARGLQDAVVIGEDNNFFTHGGIDYLAMAHAIGYPRQSFTWSSSRDRDELFSVLPRAWSRRDKLRGASTISQQLAKNLYLSSSRNPLRKVKEAVTTYRLEAALGKQRIMELYLNVTELGDGIWGAEAASRQYFKRSAARLTQEQAAALAGALPFPLSSNPALQPGRMRWRQNLILRRMHGEWVEIPKVETEDLPAPPAPDSVNLAVDSAVTGMDSIPLIQTDSLPVPPDSLETGQDTVPDSLR